MMLHLKTLVILLKKELFAFDLPTLGRWTIAYFKVQMRRLLSTLGNTVPKRENCPQG